MRKLHLGLLAITSAALLVSGCTYEPGVKSFANELKPEKAEASVNQTESGLEWFKESLKNMETNPKAQKFWYKGYVKTTILSRQTNSMYDGIVVKPEGYLVNGRIAAQPYQYLVRGDKRFIKIKENWLVAKEEPMPVNVMAGYEDWLPFLDKAVQLEDEKVLGTMCTPFQIKMTGEEWLAKSNSDLFAPLKQQLGNRSDLQQILKDSTIKMTFWIGNDEKDKKEGKDRLIHQYQTWIILPIPGAGYMDQEVLYTFFKYDDPGIKLTELDEVNKYLLE
ncbi:hypothetical protein [Brevibacillus sp. SYSU BS000544]|uniref:hypothetical protein n=1 Tax=Brevibacillus sp. SYSU BS000544 TaxID=3416443 RepID=UPI003CE5AF78